VVTVRLEPRRPSLRGGTERRHDQGAREVVALRIIELAQRGERDPERLRDRVLRESNAMSSVVDVAPDI
jgi:hypothetical protein